MAAIPVRPLPAQLSSVQRVSYSQPGLVHDVGIDLGRGYIGMAQEVLHRADVGTPFEQVGGEGMPEGMGRHPFVEPGTEDRIVDGVLESRVQQVVPAVRG